MTAHTRTIAHLAELAGGTAYFSELHPAPGPVIESISLDSSAVAEAGLFAALPGTRAHGANFAAQGAAAQAAAILSDAAGVEILRGAGEQRPIIEVADIRAVLGLVAAEIYDHPTRDMTVIGITGTSGKTTTSYLVESGLLAAGYSVGLIGTTGTRINREPVATKLTTPEAPKLQELFALMRSRGVSHVVMEVSSHAISLGRIVGTQFDAVGFTNLSQDHLDFHPTMEDYFAAKAQLFAGAYGSKAVVCVDDDWGTRMAQHAAQHGLAVTTVSTGSQPGEADVVATQTSVEPTGAQQVHMQWRGGQPQAVDFRLPMPGVFNIANAALATGLVQSVGVDHQAFIGGIEQVAVPGRLERIDLGQDFIAVVDYAHKPAAVAAVLDSLAAQISADARIAVVIGAGGDRDQAKRPLMGANAAQRAHLVIVTDDNPRSEDPAVIRKAVLDGALEAAAGRSGVEVREEGSRAAAIDAAIAWARPGDAVIVVGKGHEVGQTYGERTLHFDDREEVRRALHERLGTQPTEAQGEQA